MYAIESILILTEIRLWYISLTITGGSSFSDNTAGNGGGMCTLSSTIKVEGISTGNVTGNFSRSCNTFTSVFMDNSAQFHGGGLYTKKQHPTL